MGYAPIGQPVAHSPRAVSFSFLLVLSLPSPSPLFYCQAVKWMLAYCRAPLSNSLSCAGQVRGSAECDLAADETATQRQLARPPTAAPTTGRSFCSQVKWRALFIAKGQRISVLLMRNVCTSGHTTWEKKGKSRFSLKGQYSDNGTSSSRGRSQF